MNEDQHQDQPQKIEGRAQTREEKRALLDRLLEAWMKYPDFRLSQMIVVVANFGSTKNSLFMIEDEGFVHAIEEFMNSFTSEAEQ